MSQGLPLDYRWTITPAPQGVGVAIARGRRQTVNNRKGNAQPVDETQIVFELVAGDTPGGKPGMFVRQAPGAYAYSHACPDENTASDLYLHALCPTDADAYAYLYIHACSGDGNIDAAANADTPGGNSRTGAAHGDTTTTAAAHQHSRSATTHGYANSRAAYGHVYASIRVYYNAMDSRHRLSGGDEGHSSRG